MMKPKWIKSAHGDSICDLCGKKPLKYFVDGKLIEGPWALICDRCFPSRGVGLGIGYGQKYSAKTNIQLAGGIRTGGQKIKLTAEAKKHVKI